MVEKLTHLSLLLLISSYVHAAKIEKFTGLENLIQASDTIVILRIERSLSDSYRKGSYSTYECYIYQTLKGQILPDHWFALELMDSTSNNISPYAPGSAHLIFLKKKEKQNELAKYCSLPYEGANVALSHRRYYGNFSDELLEQTIQSLLMQVIRDKNQQHQKNMDFLITLLRGPKDDKPKPGDLPEGLLEKVKQSEVDFEDCQPQHLVKIIQVLHRSRDHSRVIQAGKTALQMSLPAHEDATVRLCMARSYEGLNDENSGSLAKQKYQEILEMHPEYERNIEVALRLGELNDNIILRGTQRNTEEAIRLYQYIVDRYTRFDVVYYEVLEAHMGLGNLLWDKDNYDGATRHFEALYHVDPDLTRPLSYMYYQKDYNIYEEIEWLRKRAVSIQETSKEKLVNLCVRPGFEESIDRLEKLQEEYADDAELVDMAKERILKLNQVRP